MKNLLVLCLGLAFIAAPLGFAFRRRDCKLLLQSKKTGEYVSHGGDWTPNRRKARVFRNGLDAVMFCLNRRISAMQIVCVFKNLAKNFTVPVTDEPQSS
jgi:hypothetical protein